MVTSSFPRWRGDSTAPFVLHLAQDLQSMGWTVDVIAPHAPNAAVQELMEGVRVERFRYFLPESQQTVCYQGGALYNLRNDRSNIAKLPFLVSAEWWATMRQLASGQYDIVHSHWILPQGFVVAVAKRRGTPHVLTVHGSDIFGLRGRWMAKFKRFALNRADAVTANSSATERAVRDVAPELSNIRRIPMGATEIQRDETVVSVLRAQYSRGGPVLLFVGRLVEQKGAADFIRAVPLVAARFPDTTAVIVGDGPMMEALKSTACNHGVAQCVFFPGWVPHTTLANYLALADVFIAPSREADDGAKEGQGLAIVEAMLARIPIIATRTGGIPDLIKDGETGLLVDEKSPEQIATAIERLAFDKSLGKRLTASAQVHARKQYTRAHSAAAFSKLYCDVIERRQYQRSHLEIEQD